MLRFLLFIAILFVGQNCNNNPQQNVAKENQNKNPISGVSKPCDKDFTFVQPAGKKQKIRAGKPEIKHNRIRSQPYHNSGAVADLSHYFADQNNKPGRFPPPHIKYVAGSTRLAGLPEISEAKEGSAREHNPANLIYFRIQHGLIQTTIRCMTQDQAGNLWFGTYSGGVTRYDGSAFSHFGIKQGLSSDVVLSILEDSAGNLWFGTSGGGVVRFDGINFTSYSEAQGFLSNTVYSICQDHHGKLWFGTENGLSSYDGEKFTSYSKEQGLPGNQVYKVITGKNGTIWCGTNKGVAAFSSGNFTIISAEHGLSSNMVISILESKSGDLWFGTIHGVNRLRGTTLTSIGVEEGLSDGVIYSISEDPDGNIWFGTRKGLNRFDGHNFNYLAEEDGLINEIILSTLLDRSQNLWIGTNSGLILYKGPVFQVFSQYDGLPENVVLAMAEDKKGNIWFGTHGRGVSRYSEGIFRNYDTDSGLPANTIYDIYESDDGKIWFATDASGVFFYQDDSFYRFGDIKELNSTSIYCIAEDKNGDIWFGTEGKGAIKYNGKEFIFYKKSCGLPGNTIYTIFKDSGNRLWFGTDRGLSCFDGRSFTNYNDTTVLQDNRIFCIIEDKNTDLWIGTNSGVVKSDGAHFTLYGKENGFKSEAVLSLIEDKAGNIWCGTREGIVQVSYNHERSSGTSAEISVYNIGFNEGFRGVSCKRNSVLKDSQGHIWWGADVLMKFDPRYFRPDKNPPSVVIRDFRLFNQIIPWNTSKCENQSDFFPSQKKYRLKDTTLENRVALKRIVYEGIQKMTGLPTGLSLPHNNNNITINFSSTKIQDNDHIKYQYMLAGLDTSWNLITTSNEASYVKLPAGDFNFRVKAMNQFGVWSPITEFKFSVRPAWWATWWFRVLLILLVILLFSAYMRWRDKMTVIEKEELELQNKKLTKINQELDRFVYSASHELRSPLTSILGLLNLLKSEEKNRSQLTMITMIETAINRLDGSIHDIISYSRNARMSVNIELVDFKALIDESLENLAFMPERSQLKTEVSVNEKSLFYSDRNRIQILINNLISNAFKYAVHSENESFVAIQVEITENAAILIVKDNGIGIPKEYQNKIFDMFFRATNTKTGAGLGLYICKEITEKLGGKIMVRSEPGISTEFEVSLPNRIKEFYKPAIEPTT